MCEVIEIMILMKKKSLLSSDTSHKKLTFSLIDEGSHNRVQRYLAPVRVGNASEERWCSCGAAALFRRYTLVLPVTSLPSSFFLQLCHLDVVIQIEVNFNHYG